MNQEWCGSEIVSLAQDLESTEKSSNGVLWNHPKSNWFQIPSSKKQCLSENMGRIPTTQSYPIIIFPMISSRVFQVSSQPRCSYPWATARQHHSAILRGWSDVFHGDDLIRVQLHVIDELHDLPGWTCWVKMGGLGFQHLETSYLSIYIYIKS